MSDVFSTSYLSSKARAFADANADPNNWKWEDYHHERQQSPLQLEHWRVVNRFQDVWYNAAAANHSYLADRHPSLDLKALMQSMDVTCQSPMLVRSCYKSTFESIYSEALEGPRDPEGPAGAVIVTGQPGTGKTTFLYYLLARLLQQKQVVLFSPDGVLLRFFFHDKVYQLPSFDVTLPEPRSEDRPVFIWSLFDIKEEREPSPIMYSDVCFPVQTASPNEARYKNWVKEQALHHYIFFPLWDVEELRAGFKLQRHYEMLETALNLLYPQPVVSDGRDRLQTFRGIRKLLDMYEEEQEDDALSVDGAIQYLLDAAISRFGYAAGDVFEGIFGFDLAARNQMAAIPVSYSDLLRIVAKASSSPSATTYQTIAIIPVGEGDVKRSFDIDFKSAWIRGQVFRRLGTAEDFEIRRDIAHSYSYSFPPRTAVAGYLFESLAHTTLCKPAGSDTPQLITMEPNDAVSPSPTFSSCSECDITFATAVERPIEFLEDTLPENFEGNTYYVPMASNYYPLIDAYTADMKADGSTVLWLIQITTSKSHGSSTKGYAEVRTILRELKKTLRVRQEPQEPPRKKFRMENDQTPLVVVRWLLVVVDNNGIASNQSGDAVEYNWHFPAGWNEGVTRDDHRGKVYCLRLPLP